ncbi:hypothetical protein CRYUN_Cryun18bG0081700 [Craigia yunnanensis]
MTISDCCTWTGVTCDNSTARSKRVVSLELGGKKLSGTICDSLAGLHQLRILNLSHNLLRGSLSTKLFRMQNLEVLDISDNSFVGRIPEEIQRLHVLNLNENHLSGSIPESLSGMTSLEILDLSHNKIAGKIPNSLVKLSFLSKFSVAYNELYGEIPVGTQFMTFPSSSFEGNNGLCGGSYSPCPLEHTSIASPDEPMTIVGSQFGYGVATGFLLTIAICFMSGWILPREAPFQRGSIQDKLLAARRNLVSSHLG